jgi:hypothetical protein
MYSDTRDWVSSCNDCAMRKAGRLENKLGMTYSIESSRPFQILGVDIKGPLKNSSKNGNRYILVMTDHFTKWVELFPMKNVDAGTVADLILKEFICRHGAPESILTDRGRNFSSNLIIEISRKMDIKRLLTASYHPQTNGQTERFNRTMAEMLTMYISEHETDWEDYLPYVAFAYRTAIHESTGETPFKLMYGRDVRMGETWQLNEYNDEFIDERDWVEQMHHIWEKVKEYSDRIRSKRETEVNKRRKMHGYQIDDLVWLRAVPKPGKTPSFQNKWIGPYRIVEFVTPVTVRLQDLESRKVREPVHVSRIKEYIGKEIKATMTESEQDGEYEVESIEDVRIRKGKRQYLIKWKDYEEMTWESVENLNCDDLVQKFHQQYKLLCNQCGFLVVRKSNLSEHSCQK